MADNIAVTAGTGTNIATDDIGSVHYQRIKVGLGDNGTAVDWAGGEGAKGTNTARVTIATDDTLVTSAGTSADAASATGSLHAKLRGIATALGITAFDLGSGTGGTRTLRTMLDTTQIASTLDVQTTVTRPADNNDYAAGDAFANSTSAPTAGGYTFSSAASASGGGGVITDLMVVASDAKLYEGEIWIADSAYAAVPNDNAAFACSDADHLLVLGIIPFACAAKVASTSVAHVTGVNLGYHCVGTANLRFIIRLTAAIVAPGSAATLTFRIKGIRN